MSTASPHFPPMIGADQDEMLRFITEYKGTVVRQELPGEFEKLVIYVDPNDGPDGTEIACYSDTYGEEHGHAMALILGT